jgi:protein-disulfide isomerase
MNESSNQHIELPRNDNPELPSAAPQAGYAMKASNPWAIPASIVIAGALIAGGIYLTRGGNSARSNLPLTMNRPDITVAPITTKDKLLGSPNATVSLIEYSDLECPACKEYHKSLHELMDVYGKEKKVNWVYRHFPLYKPVKRDDGSTFTLHSKAGKEAEAAECAYELGGNTAFWAFIDRIFTITPSNNGLDLARLPEAAGAIGLSIGKFNECLQSSKYASAIDASYNEALKAGAKGTPYTVALSQKKITDDKQTEILRNFANRIEQLYPGQSIPSNVMPEFGKDGYTVVWNSAFPAPLIEAIIDPLSR